MQFSLMLVETRSAERDNYERVNRERLEDGREELLTQSICSQVPTLSTNTALPSFGAK